MINVQKLEHSGDKVLVLLPIPGKILHTQYFVPCLDEKILLRTQYQNIRLTQQNSWTWSNNVVTKLPEFKGESGFFCEYLLVSILEQGKLLYELLWSFKTSAFSLNLTLNYWHENKKEHVFHKGIFSLNRPMTIVYLDVDDCVGCISIKRHQYRIFYLFCDI